MLKVHVAVFLVTRFFVSAAVVFYRE